MLLSTFRAPQNLFPLSQGIVSISKSDEGAFKFNFQRYYAQFTLGVKVNVQLKSSIPIGANVEISPKGFKLGVKAETQKNIFNLPQVTSKCRTLWPCIDPKGEKTSTIKFGKPICNPWGRTKSQKMLEVGSKFFSPDSWCKVRLVPTNHDQRIPNGCLLIG